MTLEPWLNKVHIMDCLDGMVLMPRLSVDLTIMDPPFSLALGSAKVAGGTKNSKIDNWHDLMNSAVFYKELFESVLRVSKEDAGIWCFSSWRSYPVMAAGIMKAGLVPTSVLVWDKDWITAGLKGLRSCYELVVFVALGEFEIKDRSIRDIQVFKWSSYKPLHPAQKPLDLVRWLIRISGTPEVILDPFTGSGTVPVAAKECGANFVAFELNEKYAQAAEERLQQTQLGDFIAREPIGLEAYIEWENERR